MKKQIAAGIISLMVMTGFTTNAQASENNALNLYSQSAVLIDAKTGDVLYEKNAHQKEYPASITKVATAIVAMESGKLEDKDAVTSKLATTQEPSSMGLVVGEKKSIRELLYGLILKSGNDAAIVIAENCDGNVQSFADKMNQLAYKVSGDRDTHFTNPNGLHDPNHYTTSYDMAMMVKYALLYPLFVKMISTSSYQWNGETGEQILYNEHPLFNQYDGLLGGKTGYTDEAENTLVSIAQRGDTELIAVTMRANGKWAATSDAKQLLDFGFNNYTTKNLFKKGQVVEVPSAGKFTVPEDIFATVSKKGDKVEVDGTGAVHMNGKEIGKLTPLPVQIKKGKTSVSLWICEAILALAGLLWAKEFVSKTIKRKVKITPPKSIYKKKGVIEKMLNEIVFAMTPKIKKIKKDISA